MKQNWFVVKDDGDDGDNVENPRRRDGTFSVFEFSDGADRLPSLLEQIAAWLRQCTEYQITGLSMNAEDGWATVSVTAWEVRPGDLIKSLAAQGHSETAASIANLIADHGVREGLRRAGLASR